MNSRKATILIPAFLLFSFNVFCQQDETVFDSIKLIAAGAKLYKISSQFSFTEGPAVDKKGNIYFTDQPNDKIWKYDTDENLSLYMEKTGRSNGLYIDKKGNIISCADEKNELWAISSKGKITVLLDGFQGRKFNGPNDLWIHPKGGIYFTDPRYGKADELEMSTKQVYYLPPGGKPVLGACWNMPGNSTFLAARATACRAIRWSMRSRSMIRRPIRCPMAPP